MARLIVEHKAQVLRDYPFGKKSLTIGRFDDNNIVLDDPSVSGYHARIDKRGVDFILTDLQSTNGTTLNDTHIVSHKLTHGDRVMIGEHAFLFVGTEMAKAYAEEQALDLNKTTIRGAPERRMIVPEPITIKNTKNTTTKAEHRTQFWTHAPVLASLFLLTAGLWLLLSQNSGVLEGLLSFGVSSHTAAGKEDSLGGPLPIAQSNEAESVYISETVSGEFPSELLSDADWADSEWVEETPEGEMEEPAYVLEGIVMASEPQDSFAVINGRMVRLGGIVGEGRITEIGRNYVLLQHPMEDTKTRLTLRR